jgi:short-subunit dehydrogenase
MIKRHFLKDKIAIVTGGGTGLGAALVAELAYAGAKTIIFDKNSEKVFALMERLSRQCVLHVPTVSIVDVTDFAAMETAIQEIQQSEGRLDLIINNAGIMIVGEVQDMQIEQFRKLVEINLMGVIHGSLPAFKVMVRQGYGQIINISSVSGLVANPLYAAYSMTKHGVVGFSNALREEGKEFGVGVTVVCPGTLQTDIFASGTVINAPKETVFKESALASMSATRAAKIIISKIPKNPRMLVFPRWAFFIWILERIHPLLTVPLNRVVLRNFRKNRKK